MAYCADFWFPVNYINNHGWIQRGGHIFLCNTPYPNFNPINLQHSSCVHAFSIRKLCISWSDGFIKSQLIRICRVFRKENIRAQLDKGKSALLKADNNFTNINISIFSLRLQNMFQQLERVGGKAARNQVGEELQQMRYSTCKIYQILCTQGKLEVEREGGGGQSNQKPGGGRTTRN